MSPYSLDHISLRSYVALSARSRLGYRMPCRLLLGIAPQTLALTANSLSSSHTQTRVIR